MAVGNIVFFVGGDEQHGYELWKTNGTVAGTALVKDIYPGPEPNSSYPFNLYNFKGKLYFSAYNGYNFPFLWTSDGTRNGTTLVKALSVFQSDVPFELE